MAYVYIYYDPRKEPIEPIYVGKGNGDRIIEHLYKSSNNILDAKMPLSSFFNAFFCSFSTF